jgi:exonuclease SbcC
MGDISSATANLKRAKTENEQAQELLKKSENAHITAINEYETLKNDLDKLKAKAEEIKSGFGDIISEEKIRESEDRAKSAKEFLACVMQINALTEVILDKEKDLAKRKAEGEELRKQQTELRDNLVKNCGTFVLSEISKKIDELRQKDKELEVQRKQIEELLKNLSDREILLKEKKKNKLEFYESLKNEHSYCEKVDQNAVVRVEQELAQTENAIIKTVSDRSSLQTQVKDIEKRLEQKKNKEKELQEKQKRHDNLKELKELVKGSAFTDFVADAFIEEITIDASERMSKLSCGQYSLYYDDGVFFVKDYLSAGESRNVTTLSGGEKFLASLSLAIAISRRTAQSRDYGFFFIDEGFGTLDENALETVCASLEALAQDTVVGVITHRSELIERIPSVLHVEKADGISGSKCSERF